MSKIILITSLTVLGTGFLVVPSTFAQPSDNLVVQFEQTPLFNEANFLPGEGVTRWIKVTNNSGSTQKIAIETINENDPDDFASQLSLVIKEGTAELYNNTLHNFFDAGEFYLSDLATGITTQYDLTITFNSASGNPWQEKGLGFDILIGFQGTVGGESYGNGGGTNNILGYLGDTGGGGLSQGLTILDESVRVINVGETSVTIIWTTSYRSTSQVLYGAENEAHTLNLSDNAGSPPKYGYSHTTPEYDINPKVTDHSVTITGLTAGTTYYFRAVSHASLALTLEHNFTTLIVAGGGTGVTGGGEISGGREVSDSNNLVMGGGTGEGGGTDESEGVGADGEENESTNETEFNFNNLLAAINGFFNFGNLKWLLILALLILLGILTTNKKKKKEPTYS